jgi:competence protein ComEC
LERVDRLEDPVARGLAASLCLGDRSRLPWGLADLFTRTGTRHLLAVSGLHVGLLALLLGIPALLVPRRTGRRISQRNGHGRSRVRPVAALLRAGLILILVPLTGGAPPVRRAALVLALASVAPALPGTNGLRRRADPLSLWSLALALELLSNPLAFDSLSLRLSYTATLGLILGAGPLDRLLGRHLPWFGPIAPVGRLADPRRSLWRVPLSLFLRAVRGSLAVSLAAVGATLPFAWTVFGEWSPVGPAATCLALIPVALLLASGWVMLLAGDLAWIAEPLGEVFTVTAHALVASLEIWDALPGTPTPLPPRPAALVWIAVIGGFALLRRPRDESTPLRSVRRWLARTTALAWGALLLPWSAAPLGLEVHVLDVGHGTAVVLRAPGEPAWVLDAGSRDRPGVARRAVAPLLRLWDVGTIGVVLTHGDADHAGALPWIVARFPARLWAGAPPPGDLSPKSIGERLDLVAGRKRIPPRRSGEHVPRLVLLRGGDARGNEGSRALEVTWEGHRLLLTGDAEGEGLAAQLRAGWVHGPLDLLLLPHHGSQTPYLGPLLSVTMPERVWVSESGLPSLAPELDRRGLSWSCTGRDGPLSLFLAGGDAVRSRTAEQQLWNGINPE